MRKPEGRTVGLYTKVSPEELVKLLRSISSNVNQIARRCNETRNLYAQDVEDLRQGYAQVWQGIHELLKKFETL